MAASSSGESTRWKRIGALFNQALDLPVTKRTAFLANANEDEDLRQEVAQLLKHVEVPDDWTLNRIIADSARRFMTDIVPERIGAYRVLREIGRGGMGKVYLAERDDEVYRQTVAIKVVAGMLADEAASARFRNERQILADLQHPNITRLLDGGSTELGLPYLVMEYVEGDPIDDYCIHNMLEIDARLKLFREVCAVVSYAHTNLIVHRDLKPSNILVTADGGVMLLDFGIAKLMDDSIQRDSEATRVGLLPLTPDYASPEQFNGSKITTGSDVYSLGVVLFQLLTGQRPYNISSSSLQEAYHQVCETEAPRPSTLTAPSSAQLKRLRNQLRGDLDNIVAMALRKDPGQRYQSVQEFSEDVARYLEQRPVKARSSGTWYSLQKYVRRNRYGVSVALLITIFGAVLVAREIVLRHDAQLAQEAAKHEATKAQAVSEFLQGMLAKANPLVAQGEQYTVQQLVEDAVARMDSDWEFEEAPLVDASIRITLGNTLRGLGAYRKAATQLRKAVEIRREILGNEHIDTLAAKNFLGVVLFSLGEYDEAVVLFEAALMGRRKNLGEDHVDTLQTARNLASCYMWTGQFTKAEAEFQQILVSRRRVLGDQHLHTILSIGDLGMLYQEMGALEKALEYAREAYRLGREVLGDRHPDTLISGDQLASLLWRMKRFPESEQMFLDLQTTQEIVLGKLHPDTLITANNLAVLYMDTGRYAEAESTLVGILKEAPDVFGAQHATTLAFRANYASVFLRQDKLNQAESHYLPLLQSYAKVYGVDGTETLALYQKLKQIFDRRIALAVITHYDETRIAEIWELLQSALPKSVHVARSFAELMVKQRRITWAVGIYRTLLDHLKTAPVVDVELVNNIREELRTIERAEETEGNRR